MSSMAPTLVFRNGEAVLALGSPGGRSIPHLLSRVLLASLAWDEPTSRAVGLPHLSRRGTTLVVESDPPLPWPFPLEQLTGEVADRRRAGAYLHGVLPPLLARMAVSLEDGAPASLAGLPAFDELIVLAAAFPRFASAFAVAFSRLPSAAASCVLRLPPGRQRRLPPGWRRRLH